MTLKELESLAVTKSTRKAVAKSDTVISINKSKDHYRIRLSINREPNMCKFGTTVKWIPIFDTKNKRLYLVYGNIEGAQTYKVQKEAPESIGWICFGNHLLLNYLYANGFQKGMRLYRDWCWDIDCKRPYIDLADLGLSKEDK